jgi:hypothetical protein
VFFSAATDFTELMRVFWENVAVLICPHVKISRRRNASMGTVKKIEHHFFREIQGCLFFLEPW